MPRYQVSINIRHQLPVSLVVADKADTSLEIEDDDALTRGYAGLVASHALTAFVPRRTMSNLRGLQYVGSLLRDDKSLVAKIWWRTSRHGDGVALEPLSPDTTDAKSIQAVDGYLPNNTLCVTVIITRL